MVRTWCRSRCPNCDACWPELARPTASPPNRPATSSTSTAMMSTPCASKASSSRLARFAATRRRSPNCSARGLEFWRGPPLAGVPDTERTNAVRSRLDELRRAAVDDLIEAQLALGQHQRLVPELEGLVAEDPLREHRWGQLIRALYCSGRQADAMRAFQRARDVLVEQIGVEPGRRAPPAGGSGVGAGRVGARRRHVGPAPRSPIGEDFRRRGNVRYPVGPCIGRVADLEQLIGLIEHNRLVTLTGPGGVGKTRLAIELCVALKDDTPDGVWWVELAAARSDADVLSAVQRSLGIDGGGSVRSRGGARRRSSPCSPTAPPCSCSTTASTSSAS